MTGIVERLRQTLGGIATDDMGGDNLAITLASDFEPRCGSEELDDSGTWKQEALDKTDRLLDAIHTHYAPLASRIEAIEAENAELLDQREAAMIWGDANSARVEPLQAEIARLTEDRDRLAAQVKALREALRPFALISSEGVVKATSGHVTVTTCVEYFHRARTLLATTEPKT